MPVIRDICLCLTVSVHLTHQGMMVPLKSGPLVAPMGPEVTKRTRAEVCEQCGLKQTCHYSQAHC